jgi:hypothetical protein
MVEQIHSMTQDEAQLAVNQWVISSSLISGAILLSNPS